MPRNCRHWPLILNPAVEPLPRPVRLLSPATSNCSADHPPGDGSLSHKPFAAEGRAAIAGPQLPDLGLLSLAEYSDRRDRPLVTGWTDESVCPTVLLKGLASKWG